VPSITVTVLCLFIATAFTLLVGTAERKYLSFRIKNLNGGIKVISVASDKKELAIGPTPIVLAYFAERKRGTRKEVTRVVFQLAQRLEKTMIQINAVFRGNISGSGDAIASETVDEEIWYWFSNHFLRECPDPGEDDICFEANKSFEEYRLDRISQNLSEIRWPSEKERQIFLRALEDVISLEPRRESL